MSASAPSFSVTVLSLGALIVLSGCATSVGQGQSSVAAQPLPEAVQVPAGHRVTLETRAMGDITYECRAKTDMPGYFEWVFVAPQATLRTRGGQMVGTYYGPPATWDFNDGSKVSGAQLALAPHGNGNIPLQLVKANPAVGQGMAVGVTHIQRLATQGGVAPSMPCDSRVKGSQQVVPYQADYVFWKPV